ncbi:hypothetical protein [Shewanella indica]|nr:hypothetical protein [Shewanella indica]
MRLPGPSTVEKGNTLATSALATSELIANAEVPVSPLFNSRQFD